MGYVIDACPVSKRNDLVFLTDGFTEPVLRAKGLCREEQTQATIWIDFNNWGTAFCGRVDMGPNRNDLPEFAGETTVTGKWGGALKARLESGNFFCRTMFYRDWRRVMLERVTYFSVYNLIGVLHRKDDGTASSHADVANYFEDEVDDMIFELTKTLRGHYAVSLLLGTMSRSHAYAKEHGTETRAEVTDFKWFNGVFYKIAKEALARGYGDRCEMHTEYLEYGLVNKLLDFEYIPEVYDSRDAPKPYGTG